MIMIYYIMVKRGLMKVEEVPPKCIDEVRALLDAEKILEKDNEEMD